MALLNNEHLSCCAYLNPKLWYSCTSQYLTANKRWFISERFPEEMRFLLMLEGIAAPV